MAGDAPRRKVATLMVASGLVTAVVWLLPLLGAAVSGEPPELLGASTTMVTDALDLALITPITLLGGVLLFRHRPEGWLLAFPMLVLLISLMPMIALQTVFQLQGGIEYTAAEMIGPMGGFVVLAGIALWLLAKMLSALRIGPEK
jgi:hypothetical protein